LIPINPADGPWPVAPRLGREDSSAADIPGKPLKKTKPAAAAVSASNKKSLAESESSPRRIPPPAMTTVPSTLDVDQHAGAEVPLF
jgi:hypothetical protein